MEYIEIPDFDNDTLAKLNSADQEIVMLAILSIVGGENYELAIKATRQFLVHNNKYIRGIATESISHIARLWKKLPIDLIEKVNDSLYNDESSWVRGKAADVVDDLEIFIKGYNRPTK